MNKQDIIRAVGWDVYQAESQQARQAAPYTGQADVPVVYRSALPDAINTLIWYDPTRPSTADEALGYPTDLQRNPQSYAF